MGGARDTNFVEVFRATDNHGALYAKFLKGLGERETEFRFRNTKNHPFRLSRIYEWPNHVKQGSEW